MGMIYRLCFFWVLLVLEELTRSVRAWTAFKSTGRRLQLLKVCEYSVRQICRNAKTSHSCTARDDDRQCNAQSRGCMHARLKMVLSLGKSELSISPFKMQHTQGSQARTCRNHKPQLVHCMLKALHAVAERGYSIALHTRNGCKMHKKID